MDSDERRNSAGVIWPKGLLAPMLPILVKVLTGVGDGRH